MNHTHTMIFVSDKWNIGTLYKPGIWSFYFLSNYLGVLGCLILIYFVIRNAKRSASDVIICGLASGCITMSGTCGTQCLLNLIDGRFYGGDIACQIEAIAHISSVLTEFFSVMFTFVTIYCDKVRKRKIDPKTAIKIVITTWLFCTVITLLLSLVSPIYLMSSGAYCFFGFSSPAIALWLVPGLIISLGTMAYLHIKTLNHFKTMLPNSMAGEIKMLGSNKAITMITRRHIWLKQFRWRSIIFMIILLIGWGFAAITTVYELAVGQAAEWLVTAVGVGGVSFSWWVPLAFFYTSPYYRERFTTLLCCGHGERWEHIRNSIRISRAEEVEIPPVKESGDVSPELKIPSDSSNLVCCVQQL